ncbi:MULTISPECIES: hypothetical protein [unclassified Agarivorans]|uniref:hypothetical protein n=1 Tax=unclassified Agarivorans TaxID=2636026 RepID=UPI0010D78FCB|nr:MULTISPECIES: hypothetical protein [unclassified Agarivorans]MDO6764845.1 hypothetical protein [Agarivorans sp. 1_MG-2023]GDY25225.1 hypothetical protein AHAT_11150 [Agarivorans sp. Toyoura001]
MAIALSLIVTMLMWVNVVYANTALKFDFSVENELEQPQATKNLFSDINWLQEQQFNTSQTNTAQPVTSSEQQSTFLRYQQVPQWRANWRGGLRWQAQQNLMFRAKGNRMSGHLTLSNKTLCAICKTQIDTTVWKNGHVQLQLRSYFE